jgi:hypothetical protein
MLDPQPGSFAAIASLGSPAERPLGWSYSLPLLYEAELVLSTPPAKTDIAHYDSCIARAFSSGPVTLWTDQRDWDATLKKHVEWCARFGSIACPGWNSIGRIAAFIRLETILCFTVRSGISRLHAGIVVLRTSAFTISSMGCIE